MRWMSFVFKGLFIERKRILCLGDFLRKHRINKKMSNFQCFTSSICSNIPFRFRRIKHAIILKMNFQQQTRYNKEYNARLRGNFCRRDEPKCNVNEMLKQMSDCNSCLSIKSLTGTQQKSNIFRRRRQR